MLQNFVDFYVSLKMRNYQNKTTKTLFHDALKLSDSKLSIKNV